MFEETLARDGYIVTAVHSAEQALGKIFDYLFEVIVIDMGLPGGSELIRQIQRWSPLSRVLAVWVEMEGSTREVAITAGARTTLKRPVSPGDLRKAVYRLLDPTDSWMG